MVEMATPFGGGIGGTHRLTCGALSGALLAVGVAQASSLLSRDTVYGVASQLVGDFERAFGSGVCCELVGVDPETADWRATYEALDAHATVCEPCVEFVVRRAWELVTEVAEHG